MTLMTGEELSKKLRDELKIEIKGYMIKPCVALIQVGNDDLSSFFVKNKIKACNEVGIYLKHIEFEENVREIEIINKILELNNDDYVNAIVLHLPLGDKYNQDKIINYIARNKDVDGLTDLNVGKLINNKKTFIPPAASAVLELCDYYAIPVENKNIVIISNDSLIGKPLAGLFINQNAVVTVCNPDIDNIKDYTKKADIIITGGNKPNFIKEDIVKDEVVIFDLGNFNDNGKLVGDVDFENIKEKASYITPVPGGVGPVLVTMLLKNVVESYRKMNVQK